MVSFPYRLDELSINEPGSESDNYKKKMPQFTLRILLPIGVVHLFELKDLEALFLDLI